MLMHKAYKRRVRSLTRSVIVYFKIHDRLLTCEVQSHFISGDIEIITTLKIYKTRVYWLIISFENWHSFLTDIFLNVCTRTNGQAGIRSRNLLASDLQTLIMCTVEHNIHVPSPAKTSLWQPNFPYSNLARTRVWYLPKFTQSQHDNFCTYTFNKYMVLSTLIKQHQLHCPSSTLRLRSVRRLRDVCTPPTPSFCLFLLPLLNEVAPRALEVLSYATILVTMA